MRPVWLMLGVFSCLLAFGACREKSSPPPPASGPECAGLDSLVHALEGFSALLATPDPAPDSVEAHFAGILTGLRHNQAGGEDDPCNYLNDKRYPDHLRFDFVDHLTTWAIRDTVDQSVRYLIKLRGVFIEDGAISEFFSEEIARIALLNPWAYQRYFDAHPSQQQLLLNSTRWSPADLPELIANFDERAPQPRLRDFLIGLQAPGSPR